ncbi:MAG: hypothetical protein EXR77_07555 [Myxococcales bacterium]|nr:hypothetical protein [Myxococcales bacterium]
MLLMIRINLLARAKGSKSRRIGPRLPDVPNLGILIFLLFLVVEGAVFYLWQMTASDAARATENQVRQRDKELKELEKNRTDIAAAKVHVDKLKKNKTLFDEMFADKIGPVNAVTYLAFITQPRDEATTASEELKAMEAAGWRVAWDAKRAWFTSFREIAGEVTLQGEALAHEDVAELQRRLESSPFFRSPKLVYQDVKRDEKLGVPYVEFSIRAWLIYLVEPAPNPEVVATEAAAAAAAAGGADGGSANGGDASGDGEGDAGATQGDAGPSSAGGDAALIGAKAPQIVLPSSASASDAAATPDRTDASDATTAPTDKPADAAAAEPDVATVPDSTPVRTAEPKGEAAKAAAAREELPPAKGPLPPVGTAAPPPAAPESAAPPSANEP